MANIKQLTKKIASLKNTTKITRAMKMIAATKLRKAQMAAEASRPFTRKLAEVLGRLADAEEGGSPLLLARRKVENITVVLITSDRGLCGAFNSTIQKITAAFIKEKQAQGINCTVHHLGKRGKDFFAKRKEALGFTAGKYLEGAVKVPNFKDCEAIGNLEIERFYSYQVDELYVAYNEFKSAITQVPNIKKLFPIEKLVEDEKGESTDNTSYIFEPEPEALLQNMTERAVKVQLFDALLSSVAGEHGARMNAMENATSNGVDLTNKYTIARNRARQAMITTELTEIISGAESLK